MSGIDDAIPHEQVVDPQIELDRFTWVVVPIAFDSIVRHIREEVDKEIDNLYDPDGLRYWVFWRDPGSDHLYYSGLRRQAAGTANFYMEEEEE